MPILPKPFPRVEEGEDEEDAALEEEEEEEEEDAGSPAPPPLSSPINGGAVTTGSPNFSSPVEEETTFQGHGLEDSEPRQRGLPSSALFRRVGVPYTKGFLMLAAESAPEVGL